MSGKKIKLLYNVGNQSRLVLEPARIPPVPSHLDRVEGQLLPRLPDSRTWAIPSQSSGLPNPLHPWSSPSSHSYLALSSPPNASRVCFGCGCQRPGRDGQ